MENFLHFYEDLISRMKNNSAYQISPIPLRSTGFRNQTPINKKKKRERENNRFRNYFTVCLQQPDSINILLPDSNTYFDYCAKYDFKIV